jgi:hypothetical protein
VCVCVCLLWSLCLLAWARHHAQAEGRQARQQEHPTQPRLARYQAFVSRFRRHIAEEGKEVAEKVRARLEGCGGQEEVIYIEGRRR